MKEQHIARLLLAECHLAAGAQRKAYPLGVDMALAPLGATQQQQQQQQQQQTTSSSYVFAGRA